MLRIGKQFADPSGQFLKTVEVTMEYEFIYDPITGIARANFSLEHEIMGPWLETEVGQNQQKLTELLTLTDRLNTKKINEMMITGREYSLLFGEDDVTVQTNASMDGIEVLPEILQEEPIAFDQNNVCACGIEDFNELLLAWKNFINK